MTPDPAPVGAPSEPTAAANPFLAASPAPAPAPVTSPDAAISSKVEGAPLQVRQGGVVPSVRDPHAEFRKGNWKVPVLLSVGAAAIVAALFYGIPGQEEDKKPSLEQASAEPEAVIGASFSPEIIQDPDRPNATAPQRSSAPREIPDEVAESPTRPDGSGDFASAFKSSAR